MQASGVWLEVPTEELEIMLYKHVSMYDDMMQNRVGCDLASARIYFVGQPAEEPAMIRRRTSVMITC